jgi:hypothetical protein
MSVSQTDLGLSRFLLLMQQATELPKLTEPPLRPWELTIASLESRAAAVDHGAP